jgi:hypothetical protein
VWYVRAAIHRGNPVYPFFSQHFGQRALHDSLPQRKTPLGWNAADLLSAPWQVTMRPERFGGRGHQLGAVFLLMLPGLLIVRRLRGLSEMLAICAAYFLAWYTLRQNVRFLYPIVPLLSAAAVWTLAEMARLPQVPRLLAGGALVSVACLGAAIPAFRARHQVAVAIGFQSRDEYLQRREPTWLAAKAARELLGPQDRILSQDYRAFYFDQPVTRENVYRHRTSYDMQVANPADLPVWLEREGFTHLLLADADGAGIRYNSTLNRLVEACELARETPLRLLVEYNFRDADGARRTYRLVRLK